MVPSAIPVFFKNSRRPFRFVAICSEFFSIGLSALFNDRKALQELCRTTVKRIKSQDFMTGL
jgi:hypothetical protein